MSKFYDVAQGSAEWYRLRLGRPTASQFDKIVTPKGEPSKQAVKYLYRLCAERLLNESQDDEIGYVQWVAHGREREPHAVAHFQTVNEVVLEPGGFWTTDDGRIGASPDRLLNNRREAFECKAPAPFTHLQYLLEGVEDAYRAQLQGQIFVGGFECVHFFSYHPQCPAYHKIILPDHFFLGQLRTALQVFCDALDIMTQRARALGAFAVARRVETPGEVAYQADEDAQLKLIIPEASDEPTDLRGKTQP